MVIIVSLATALPLQAQATPEAATPVGAAASQSEDRGYGALIDEGLAEYDHRNFLEARSLFLRAHEINPNARTLRVLGMIAFELRDYPQCVDYLQQALGSNVKPLEGELRTQTIELLGRARGFVAYVRVEVGPSNAKAQLLVNGAPFAWRAGTPIVLAVGDYEVDVHAEGFTHARRKIHIRGGEQQTLSIVLTRPMTASKSTERESVLESPWLWAGAGTVVAIGVVLAILVQPENKTEVGEPITTEQTPPDTTIYASGRF